MFCILGFFGYQVFLIWQQYPQATKERLDARANMYAPRTESRRYVFLNIFNDNDVKKESIVENLRYFLFVDEHVPSRFDVKNILGFLYYYSGDLNKAIMAFQESLEINPHYFYSWYNLGVIYFKSGDYVNAELCFTRALRLDWEVTSKIIASSQVFLNLFKGFEEEIEKIPHSFKENYLKCKYLTEFLSNKRQNPALQVPRIFNTISVRMF